MTLYGGTPDASMRQHWLLVVYTLIIQQSHFGVVSWRCRVKGTHKTNVGIKQSNSAGGRLALTLSGDEVV